MVVPIGAYKFGKNIGIGLKRNIPTCQIISSPLLALKPQVVQSMENQPKSQLCFFQVHANLHWYSGSYLKDNFITQKNIVWQNNLQI